MRNLDELECISNEDREKLIKAGIDSKEEFWGFGSKHIFLLVKSRVDEQISLESLYSFELAMRDDYCKELDDMSKSELKNFYYSL